jgi:hypothetical protein
MKILILTSKTFTYSGIGEKMKKFLAIEIRGGIYEIDNRNYQALQTR